MDMGPNPQRIMCFKENETPKMSVYTRMYQITHESTGNDTYMTLNMSIISLFSPTHYLTRFVHKKSLRDRHTDSQTHRTDRRHLT